MVITTEQRVARLHKEGAEMLRELSPKDYTLARLLLVSDKATLQGIRATAITEKVVKMMFIWLTYVHLIETYAEVAERKKRWRIPDWLQAMTFRLVMTFHPTPSQLYGARPLDTAVGWALLMHDFSYLQRAFVEVFEENELRNTRPPSLGMLLRFTRTFGKTIASVGRFFSIDLYGLSWVLVDFDGNPNQTWQDALEVSRGAASGRQFRFGAPEVEELGRIVFGEEYTREDLTAAIRSGDDLGLHNLEDNRLAQLISNLGDEHVVNAFVIADCESVEHVLLLAAFLASVGRKYRICPLLERFDRIETWVERIRELLAIPEYREFAGGVQMFQVGPSDSAAHGGFWSLMGIGHLIRLILIAIKDCGFEAVLFIGAGRNPARGGGRRLADLATLVPRLAGLVKEVQFTVQGGMVAENFRNETIGRFEVLDLLKALAGKAEHNEEISQALYKFAKLASAAHNSFNKDVRRLLAHSVWLEVLAEANFSNRPLSKGADPTGAGLRAIAVQQLLTLIGGEALLFLGWREAYEQMSEEERKLLMKSSRFRQGLRYALEATHLTDWEALSHAAHACGLGDVWFERIQERIISMQKNFTSLLGDEAAQIAEVSDQKRRELQIRRWISTEGVLSMEMPVRVLMLQCILAKLGRLG